MRPLLYVLIVGTAALLSACGGGGGGGGPRSITDTTASIAYPPCLLSDIAGKGNIAGCWISERCATNTDGAVPVRYMTEITEETFSPVTTGNVNDYLLVYDDDQCAGEPIEIVSMDERLLDTENAVRHVKYSIQGFEVCTDTQGDFNIPCMAIDMTSEYRVGSGVATTLASRDVFHYGGRTSDPDWYLCMSSAYNFDDSGNGGIGVGAMLQDRDTVLDFTDCLTRFEPPKAL